MSDTINSLLAEFGDEPYTKANYLHDRARVSSLLCAKYEISEDDIADKLMSYDLPCHCDLVQEWLALDAIAPYLALDEE